MMKIFYTVLIVIINCLISSQAQAFGRSADDAYRDLLKEENDGELPSYIVNKGIKKQSFFDIAKRRKANLEALSDKDIDSISMEAGGYIINFKQNERWEQVINSVKHGSPTAFDLYEIKKRADYNDKQAVELLAWMYAKGVGVRRNLHESWRLYKRAERMGIEGAEDNLKAVYKAMTRTEKQNLPAY